VFFLLSATSTAIRQLFMDGRAHTQDVNPIWFGESIGKWDGDDLVIDTIGFNDKFWFDLPATRTRSNCTRSNDTGALFGHLEWQTYIDDPGAYTKPFTVYGRVNLLPKEAHGVNLPGE
jgi:hypothetical protein